MLRTIKWLLYSTLVLLTFGILAIAYVYVSAERWSDSLARPAPSDNNLPDVTWPHYGNDEGGSRFSTASQIRRENIQQLKPVWVFRSGTSGDDFGQGNKFTFESTPVLAGNDLFFATAFGQVFSLDATSGSQNWIFDAALDPDENYSEVANRGVLYWADDQVASSLSCQTRIFAGTIDGRLIALDAEKGWRCRNFGKNGEVDLRMTLPPENRGRSYPVTSAPVAVNDTVILGSGMIDGWNSGKGLGTVWGLNARTGEVRWKWHAIPRDPDAPNAEDWSPEQAKNTGTANAWAPLSTDPERGLVFLVTGSASPDFYGGNRLGNNRFANSLVALNAEDGSVRWARQLVRHDLWDYDLPSQPTLTEIERDGVAVPVVIQPTKMGMLFTFHRDTGEPFHPIRQMPVPASDVPGEKAWSSQPFPVKPPPLVPHDPISEEDLWAPYPGMDTGCAEQLEGLRNEGIYTPPSLQGTLISPGIAGGSNWGSMAWHPEKQIAIANTNDLPFIVKLIHREVFEEEMRSGEWPDWEFAPQPNTPYGMRRKAFLSEQMMPCTQPPWGTLSAVDMKAGEILWQVPLGTVQDVAPLPLDLNLGVYNMGGPMVTASGLVFIAAAMDNYLRAFDLVSGKEVWRHRLPAGGQATPMTYQRDGRQYVVIAAGGHSGLGTTPGDYLVAFALAEN